MKDGYFLNFISAYYLLDAMNNAVKATQNQTSLYVNEVFLAYHHRLFPLMLSLQCVPTYTHMPHTQHTHIHTVHSQSHSQYTLTQHTHIYTQTAHTYTHTAHNTHIITHSHTTLIHTHITRISPPRHAGILFIP